ncbi:MAG: HDOD domain-containing protein [Gammaproteobacteria bacterium]|jgi:HD-like signal output (HDOD) protein|nr:HDOD domain-containing protein [Gammaproteobacteria bacterium]
MSSPEPKSAARQDSTPAANQPLLDVRSRLRKLDRLPPMPEMTGKILKLSANPRADVKELVQIVELDPSLAMQVMRYASSPFFSYQGRIDSVQTAVTRVLGYNTVLNLALGATAARSFKVPRNVPLGLEAFWRHAIYTAALAQALSGAVPMESRPPAGMAYLAGLLHNFGHLLLGHLFKQEFLILNKFILKYPDRPIELIERRVLGTDHAIIGAWLMAAWHLPEEIVIATREHHNPNYQEIHAVYPQLVFLADRLLKRHDMGDVRDAAVPAAIWDSLGIGEYQAIAILGRVMEGAEGLDKMAASFT